VPVDVAPPVTPFTCQVTGVLEEPVTVAVNVWVALARTFAEFGVTLTATVGGGGGGGAPGLPPPGPTEPLPVVPAQLACSRAAAMIRICASFRVMFASRD
jgi:hypothetical protein